MNTYISALLHDYILLQHELNPILDKDVMEHSSSSFRIVVHTIFQSTKLHHDNQIWIYVTKIYNKIVNC